LSDREGIAIFIMAAENQPMLAVTFERITMSDTAENPIVVITGASAGIGAALAEVVAQRGGHPVLVARNRTALDGVAARCAGRADVLVADVTRRAEIEAVVAETLEKRGRIDVWVNNAGRGISRLVSEITDEDFDEMMTVNVKSVLYGMQAVLPHFRERRRGHIINVSSMLGRAPFVPLRSVYSAAKHALNALTANLRIELSDAYPDIVVSSVHPGIVATGFGSNALHGGPDSRQLPGAQPVTEVATIIADVIDSRAVDVYTRPEARQSVASYFASEDMAAVERRATLRLPRP
jgi:NADP-dependent 3-hydroxy acid dehydrogenase YdfG